jgi:hypothetical protein
MLYRTAIIVLGIVLVFLAGCRTGEYRIDREVYAAMPGLLAADTELADGLFKNEDGSIKVEFEKGEMFLYLALGLDEDTRMQTASDAFVIFHDQYVNNPDNRRKDGTFIRKVIRLRGFVEDTELYVIEWDLSEDNPNVISNRYGYFI